jgi:hypothetical protein
MAAEASPGKDTPEKTAAADDLAARDEAEIQSEVN